MLLPTSLPPTTPHALVFVFCFPFWASAEQFHEKSYATLKWKTWIKVKNLISRLNLTIKKEGKFCSSKLTASAGVLTEKVFSPLRVWEPNESACSLMKHSAAVCLVQDSVLFILTTSLCPYPWCKTQSCLLWLRVYARVLGARLSLVWLWVDV